MTESLLEQKEEGFLDEFEPEGLRFEHLTIYQVRGNKYFVVADTAGFVTVFYRSLKYKTRFETGPGAITSLSKYQMNLMITSKCHYSSHVY